MPKLDQAICLLAAAILLACAGPQTGAAEMSTPTSASALDKRLLILVSGGIGSLPGIDRFAMRLVGELGNAGIDEQKIHVEYLDLTRHPGGDYRRQLAALLKKKYLDRQIDLVFCLGRPALSFLLQEADEIAPDVTTLTFAAQIPDG